MANRKFLGVADLPLVGGALCLDFINTTGARDSPTPRERLLAYADLLLWSNRAGALSEADARRLERLAKKRTTDAAAALSRALKMRERLYQLFRAVADDCEPPTGVLTQLGAWWREDRRRRELVLKNGVLQLELRVEVQELDAMLWPIIASTVDLLTSDRGPRIKRCGECDWIFLDESKNGSRAWCKKDCGDRTRARRHYARVLGHQNHPDEANRQS